MVTQKPLVLHMNPVRFSKDEWKQFEDIAEIVHISEYSRERFIEDLHNKYRNVCAIGRGYLTKQLVGRFDDELIAHFPPSLKYIAHQGAGYDQCDVEPLSEKNIQLAHCPHVISNSTADANLFLLLGAMRNFEEGRKRLSDGLWQSCGFGAGARIGINPKNKVLGIIGFGSIGRAFHERVLPLGFKEVIYYNRNPVSPRIEKGARFIPNLNDFVLSADIISINCPLNDSTYHLVDEELIKKMKDNVIIVNTARGAIIDEEALLKYLKAGKIRSVGLDVFESEPNVPQELLNLPQVLAIPHMGTHAEQTIYDMEILVIENLKSGLQNKKVINIVPEQKEKSFI